MSKRYFPFYNNTKFIILVLVALFLIFSTILNYFVIPIGISLTYFSFFLMLPLSQIYLAYKGMLDALKLDGLNQSERDRLTATVKIRSSSSLHVAVSFLLILFVVFILNSVNLLREEHLLALILSIGLSSILSLYLAWLDLKEIAMLEKTLKGRKEEREARAKVLNTSK